MGNSFRFDFEIAEIALGEVSFVSAMDRAVGAGCVGAQCAPLRSLLGKTLNKNILSSVPIALNRLLFTLLQPTLPQYKISIILKFITNIK